MNTCSLSCRLSFTLVLVFLLLSFSNAESATREDIKEATLSDDSEECISCHSMFTPGIVSDWKQSRHAQTTLERALQKPAQNRRVSVTSLEKAGGTAAKVAIGCAECHTLDPERHKDTFDHNGYNTHVIVTPSDCAHCHPVEKEQYTNQNKMAHAYGNLHDNPLYGLLEKVLIGQKHLQGGTVKDSPATLSTQMDACYGCHGTRIQVLGLKEIDTPMDTIEVPDLQGWPNMGVGRVNPDGSLGSCSPCHPRHSFSIATARKPYVCGQCHLEPDAPAWNVYKESKHGNLFASDKGSWNFDTVPWVLGKDFHAPTCAACHASLVVDPEGDVIANRTHGYSERLWTRLFGLIYSHPQPVKPDTSLIRNKDGQSLPVTFHNEAASKFLIDTQEKNKRQQNMQAVCQGCHSTQWAERHFKKMDGTIADADQAVQVATQLMQQAWKEGLADDANPFDEYLELIWTEQWLFYANSIRYAAAMAGAPDYAAFHNGWWELSKGLRYLETSIKTKKRLK